MQVTNLDSAPSSSRDIYAMRRARSASSTICRVEEVIDFDLFVATLKNLMSRVKDVVKYPV